MGITAQRDDLTAQIPVQPQDRLVWQRRVAPIGIQLDAAASRDNTFENLCDLLFKPLKGHMHTQIFVEIAQRQRQMAQHAEPPPPGQSQHFIQVFTDSTAGKNFVCFFDGAEIPAPVFPGQIMKRCDDKVKGGRVIQKTVRPGNILCGLSQLHTQLNFDPAAKGRACCGKLFHRSTPGVLAHLVAQPCNHIQMIRQANFMQPGRQRRGSHFRHGIVPVVAAG